MKKTKKKNILIGRVYDLLIIPVYIVCSLAFLFVVRNYTTKYLLPLAGILLLILAIAIVTIFYRKKVIDVLRRILLAILCICMVVGFVEFNNLNSFFGDLGGNNKVTVSMNLYSLASNDYFTATVPTYEDIANAKIGFEKSVDRANGEYVVDEIKKEYTVEDYEYSTYDGLIEDLKNGYMDVAIVNQNAIDGIEEKYGKFDDYAILLKTITYEKETNSDTNNIDVTKEPFTVLISGTDVLGTPTETSKSDVNILAMVNPKTAQINMISIPRDAFIPNPAYDYQNDKLTHMGNNGSKNIMEALSYAFDINVDFYVKVSFTSVIEMVDCLGGVKVDVPIYIEEQDENRSFAAEDLIVLYPGEQVLNGKEALAFARHRHGYQEGDIGRNRAQIQIIKGMINKLMTPEGVSKVNDLMKIVPNYVLTNFTNKQMQNFIRKQVDNLSNWTITTSSLTFAATDSLGYTASAGTAWVGYLGYDDVRRIHSIYEMMKEKKTLEEFTFDLSNTSFYDSYEFNTPEGCIYY